MLTFSDNWHSLLTQSDKAISCSQEVGEEDRMESGAATLISIRAFTYLPSCTYICTSRGTYILSLSLVSVFFPLITKQYYFPIPA